MKKITLFLLIVFIGAVSIFAQAPQAFKYQSVVRDNSGELITNQAVSFRIGILQDSINGTLVYSETHNQNTNQFGLVALEIGSGTVELGVFEDISWGAKSNFLKLELDVTGNTNYQLMGTSQLLSVPYSLNSGSLTLTDENGNTWNIAVDTQGFLYTIGNCPPTITDFDGNTYNTVQIDSQCWMAENLKTTTYRNGIPIPNVTNASSWENLSTGAYVWYNNDILWKDLYGGLYNWYATVDTNGLCPTGWHIPSDDEWTELTDYIGGTGSPHGNELKSCRQINSPLGGVCNTNEHQRWYEHFHYGTDNYGFSGLPGGYRLSKQHWRYRLLVVIVRVFIFPCLVPLFAL